MRHPDTAVAHFKDGVRAVSVDADPHTAVLRRELERVQHEIVEYLLYPGWVRLHPNLLTVRRYRVMIQRARIAECCQTPSDQVSQIKALGCQGDLARLQPGYVQQVIEHPRETFRLTANDRARLESGLSGGPYFVEHRHGTHHRAE